MIKFHVIQIRNRRRTHF